MILVIKERPLYVSTYDVFDEGGHPVYLATCRVKGQFISSGQKVHILTLDNREVAFVHRIPRFFVSNLDIYMGGKLAGTIKQKVSMFHPRYVVDYFGYSISGDSFGSFYRIEKDGRLVGSIEKKMISLGSVFTLRYENKDDEVPLLALGIGIDMAGTNSRIGWDIVPLPTGND
jgi:uncharacterized protein YxjI